MLIKETEDNTNSCKDIPCSWIGRISTIRMLTLSKAIYRFSIIPIKLPMAFFNKLEQTFFFLICMKIQKALNSQSNPEKEKWGWLLDFKLQSYTTQNSMVPAQK